MPNSFAGKYQQSKVTDNAADLVELLAAIAIGIFGMFLAKLREKISNPVIYWSGMVTSVSAAGYITMEFINASLDVRDCLRKKNNHDISK